MRRRLSGSLARPIELAGQTSSHRCLESGGVAVVRVEDGEIRVPPVKFVGEEIQGLAAKYFASFQDSVDSFLDDRRIERSREK
jgi:hypothetical protein